MPTSRFARDVGDLTGPMLQADTYKNALHSHRLFSPHVKGRLGKAVQGAGNHFRPHTSQHACSRTHGRPSSQNRRHIRGRHVPFPRKIPPLCLPSNTPSHTQAIEHRCSIPSSMSQLLLHERTSRVRVYRELHLRYIRQGVSGLLCSVVSMKSLTVTSLTSQSSQSSQYS